MSTGNQFEHEARCVHRDAVCLCPIVQVLRKEIATLAAQLAAARDKALEEAIAACKEIASDGSYFAAEAIQKLRAKKEGA